MQVVFEKCFSAQLAQSQIISTQVHLIPEFETVHSTSDLSSFAANTTENIKTEALGACDNIRTDGQNTNSVSRETDSRTSSIPGNAADENDCPIMSADEPKKLMQDHFLDEDSLLENLPKFEHSNASGLPCELTRNVNWLKPKSPNAKPDFEIYDSDEYVSRQRKQVLQARNIHRSNGTSTRGANEGRSGGLPPMPPYHQSNDNNWHKHSQNGSLSRNYPARPFSTSDSFVRSQERNSYDK
ncbi:hypothetical protein LOAG_02450 [Loa loa]|nr:hypothetical protein LOAG_02450 [Loa loa]EFO26040.2 hypothetical protein LOAG_02450 [Loa loa]